MLFNTIKKYSFRKYDEALLLARKIILLTTTDKCRKIRKNFSFFLCDFFGFFIFSSLARFVGNDDASSINSALVRFFAYFDFDAVAVVDDVEVLARVAGKKDSFF